MHPSRRLNRDAKRGPNAKRGPDGKRGPEARSPVQITQDHFPGFFDRFPRFEDSSSVSSDLSRLNFRAHMIIGRNRALIEGRRLLDLACHDARFTMAALVDGGAAHVTGIEARADVAQAGRDNLAHYDIGADRANIITGDIFAEIDRLERGAFDTVMCLGILYHTARQYELARSISQLGAQAVIIDSAVLPDTDEPIVQLKWEGTAKDGAVWDATRDKVLSAVPSAAALVCYFEEFGYRVTVLQPDVAVPMKARVYARGQRVTMVAIKEV